MWIFYKIYLNIVTHIEYQADPHYLGTGPVGSTRLTRSRRQLVLGLSLMFLARSLFHQPGAQAGAATGSGGLRRRSGRRGRLRHRTPSLLGTLSGMAQWLATWTCPSLDWHQKWLRSCCIAGCGTAGTPGAAAAAAAAGPRDVACIQNRTCDTVLASVHCTI